MSSFYNSRFIAEQSSWLESQLSQLDYLRELFESRHKWLLTKKGGLNAANTFIRYNLSLLKNTCLLPTCAGLVDCSYVADMSPQKIEDFAERLSFRCQRIVDIELLPAESIKTVMIACGLSSDVLHSYDDEDWYNYRARASCKSWWRRVMRKHCTRIVEGVCRDTGYVKRGISPYASQFANQAHKENKARNAAILESITATNSAGQSYSLADLALLGQANPVNRRNELMVRIRGAEEYAVKQGDSSRFVTITCPSKYHVFSGSRRNSKYGGYSPRAAIQYLNKVWAKVRAKLNRLDVHFYGLKVVEPHHDGCPHWHVLLFGKCDALDQFDSVCSDYALREDGDEKGAAKNRYLSVKIDPLKGSAAGYVAKYISKNVDGFAVGDDFEANAPADQTAKSVSAWASIWGIRQFSFIGFPSVTMYRELRRAANNRDRLAAGAPIRLIDIADKADWCRYMFAMLPGKTGKKEWPVELLKLETSLKTQELNYGKYGEIVEAIKGLIGPDFLIITRPHEWKMTFKQHGATRAPPVQL